VEKPFLEDGLLDRIHVALGHRRHHR
jgi:hypothetical protein